MDGLPNAPQETENLGSSVKSTDRDYGQEVRMVHPWIRGLYNSIDALYKGLVRYTPETCSQQAFGRLPE